MSTTNPVTCSICGTAYRRPAPDSCMRCGASSHDGVRWWNSTQSALAPRRQAVQLDVGKAVELAERDGEL